MVASFLNPIKISVFVIAGEEGLVAGHLFVTFVLLSYIESLHLPKTC